MNIRRPTMLANCGAMLANCRAIQANRPATDIRRRTMNIRRRTSFPGIEIFCHVLPFSGKEEGMRLLNSGFTELTPEDFYDKGTFIHAQLTGNTYYATTNPTLAAIQALLTPLDTALKMPPGQAATAPLRRRGHRSRKRCRISPRTWNRPRRAISRR
jgi:hypothetical protein